LNDNVVSNRKIPGNSIIHQATVNSCPLATSASMRPHEGVVCGTPTPRNESAASKMMLLGMIRVA